jgi:hypothetical protein
VLAEGGDGVREVVVAERAEDSHAFDLPTGLTLLRPALLLLLPARTALLLLLRTALVAFYFFAHLYIID